MPAAKPNPVQKLMSGGQTGADRAALDWAIANRVEHGGWCPKGRLAEDGAIPSKYHLSETPSADYAERTACNVRDSDGTVVFSTRERLTGGSLTALESAIKQSRPYLHLHAAHGERAGEMLSNWLNDQGIRVLNVAGPRSSEEPMIGEFVKEVLSEALLSSRQRG